MSMTLNRLTETEQAAEAVSIALHHLMDQPLKAKEALDDMSERFPELFGALSNLVVTMSNTRKEKLQEAAIELLASAGMPFNEDDISLVLRDVDYRTLLVTTANNFGNDSRERAQTANACIYLLLLKN